MSFDYLSYSYFITFIHILLLLIVFVTLYFIIYSSWYGFECISIYFVYLLFIKHFFFQNNPTKNNYFLLYPLKTCHLYCAIETFSVHIDLFLNNKSQYFRLPFYAPLFFLLVFLTLPSTCKRRSVVAKKMETKTVDITLRVNDKV